MNSTLSRSSTRAAPARFFALAALVLTLAALAAVSGCDRKDQPADSAEITVANEPETPNAAPTTDLRVVASDDLPANPERIVSLAPNVTEILFAVGAGPRVVAVTRFDDYPPQVESLPKIGGIIDVDLEAILAQRPDLIVGTSAGANADLLAKLDKVQLPYLFVQMNTLDEIYGGIRKFGDAVGRGEQAARVAAEMKAEIDAIAAKAEPSDSKTGDSAKNARPRVLLVYGHDPLVAAGPGSFGHQLLELAGGQNVLAGAMSPYPNLDVEKVLSLNPERIIDATVSANTGAKPLDTPFWSKYDSIAAVRNDHVYRFENPVLLRPAPRLVEGLKMLRAAIGDDKQPEINRPQ
jgi:iron complex transport system substrate-binding protein